MRFSKDDLEGIMSQDHLRNTAVALGKDVGHISAEDLISHWIKHHVQMTVNEFLVAPHNLSEQQDDVLFI